MKFREVKTLFDFNEEICFANYAVQTIITTTRETEEAKRFDNKDVLQVSHDGKHIVVIFCTTARSMEQL